MLKVSQIICVLQIIASIIILLAVILFDFSIFGLLFAIAIIINSICVFAVISTVIENQQSIEILRRSTGHVGTSSSEITKLEAQIEKIAAAVKVDIKDAKIPQKKRSQAAINDALRRCVSSDE